MNFIRTILLYSFLLSTYFGFSQSGTIKGNVYDKKSSAPIIFAQVYFPELKIGTVTDQNGFFLISKIQAGKHLMQVSYLGYDTVIIQVNIRNNAIISKKIYLNEKAIQISGATISAEREAGRTDTRISVVKATPKQIKRLPTIGGQADLAQYLQVVPGVVFTGDQGGQLYIRGGTPIQNKVLLDGMTIYNPFHSIGLFSVFDADLISTADIYTGGFGAEYGGRISSVMDVKYRYGNPKRLGGKFDISTFGTKLSLEGPIMKENDPNKGSISFVLSAKNSYIDKTSQSMYPYINEGAGIPFSFNDYYGKLSFNGANGNRMDLFGFNFNDQVTYKTINNYEWHSWGGGMKFSVVPGTSPMLLEGHVSYSDYKIDLEDGTNKDRYSEIGGFEMGLDFTYFLGKNRIKYGLELKGFTTDYRFENSVSRTIYQKESTTEFAGYISTKFLFGHLRLSGLDEKKINEQYSRLIVVPGLRLQYYASLNNFSPEPRLAVKYNINSDLRLKFAAGIYSQNLISTSSDRDVVNLFNGFISGPENLQTSFNGEPLTHKLQKANHVIAGFEYDLNERISVNIEAYYKAFTQLTNINRNKVFDDTPDYLDKPDALKKDFIVEVGSAQGADASIKYDYKRVYLWAVYSMGFNNRFDGLINYIPHYDRRHNVNLLATYTLGSRMDWEIDLRWNYGSGFPFTPTAGNYELLNFANGINTDYTVANGTIGTVYGPINSKRLPSYHRLDFGIKKIFLLSEISKLEIVLSVTNVYNRNNIFYIDRITNERVDQLPFMPSLGLNLKF